MHGATVSFKLFSKSDACLELIDKFSQKHNYKCMLDDGIYLQVYIYIYIYTQGGSNMTGTDFFFL